MSNIFKPKVNQPIIKLSAFLTLATTLLLVSFFSKLQPQLPLFYTLALPEQALVNKEYLFLIPMLSLIIFASHFLIYKKALNLPLNPIVWQLFWSVTLVLQILLTISLLRIILITL